MNEASQYPGFRLHRLELFNWGTFDQTVHSLCPAGESVLLVGENGAGKSTLIDAVLTLLVRPGVRNYNVAAGAGKKERDETSYIRGAYDKFADQDDRLRTRYLRDRRDFHTALLAELRCTASSKIVTVCQVMHAGADRRVVWYGISTDERSIANDLSRFDSVKSIKREMEVAGWEVTDSFTQYHARLQRKLKFKPKAMDVFNQTVAVKDVAKLNDFIRTHMLEKKSYSSKVDKLLRHFAELSETYRKLLEVRAQAELLVPIDRAGTDHESIAAKLHDLTSQRRWLNWYFDDATATMLEPLCAEWTDRVGVLTGEVASLDQQIDQHGLEIGAVQAQVDGYGDGRIRTLQQTRREQLAESGRKRALHDEIQRIATECSLRCDFTSLTRFDSARQRIREHCDRLQVQNEQSDDRRMELLVQIQACAAERAAEEAELESLGRRKNNLPSHLIDVRDGLCETLRLAGRDLPFAAELIQVRPEHLSWEASIELVLGGFARTLLVEETVYNDVSHLINDRRLRDGRGGGVKIAYDRVGRLSGQPSVPDDRLVTLCDMIDYRPGNPLSPYVRGRHRRSVGRLKRADRFTGLVAKPSFDLAADVGR
ncbi:MAG: ATP-binding protein [Planctomycetota bacterium]